MTILMSRHCTVLDTNPTALLASIHEDAGHGRTVETFSLTDFPFEMSGGLGKDYRFTWNIHSIGRGKDFYHDFLPGWVESASFPQSSIHQAATVAPPGRRKKVSDRPPGDPTWSGKAYPNLDLTGVRTAEGMCQLYMKNPTKVLIFEPDMAHGLAKWLGQ